MIEGHYNAGASLRDMPNTSLPADSDSEKSGRVERFVNKGITILPSELIVKVLSRLDLRDISTCRCVNRNWRILVDGNYLQALSFSRCFRYRPIPHAVDHYRSLTRRWLTSFSHEGKEMAGRLDKLLEHKHFPEILFFSIAELSAKTTLLTSQDVFTVCHAERVNNARFSPDGRHFATASDDNTAIICGFVAGQWQKKVTIQHSKAVNNASFSPDGSYLVTASDDKTAKIWRLVAGQWQEETTIRHSGWVRNASFSPDGSHLVTASTDRTAKIWALVSGQWQEKAVIQHSDWLKNANFSPDGIHLATASGDGTAKIWRLVAEQWQETATIRHTSWVHNARFSPDGSRLVTASADHTARIWELVAGQWQEEAIIRHRDWVNNASFSPDGRRIVTASVDCTARIWEHVAGQWLEKARFLNLHYDSATVVRFDGVNNASFSPDGHHVVTASAFIAKIWGLVTGRWQEKIAIQHSIWLTNASFSPDGGHLLTACADFTAKIWMLKSAESKDVS